MEVLKLRLPLTTYIYEHSLIKVSLVFPLQQASSSFLEDQLLHQRYVYLMHSLLVCIRLELGVVGLQEELDSLHLIYFYDF